MATNLRLRPEAESALRAAAVRSGRSQQELLRAAVDQYLGLTSPPDALPGSIDDLIARGTLIPPATPYRRVEPMFVDGKRTEDFLDREDRF